MFKDLVASKLLVNVFDDKSGQGLDGDGKVGGEVEGGGQGLSKALPNPRLATGRCQEKARPVDGQPTEPHVLDRLLHLAFDLVEQEPRV